MRKAPPRTMRGGAVTSFVALCVLVVAAPPALAQDYLRPMDAESPFAGSTMKLYSCFMEHHAQAWDGRNLHTGVDIPLQMSGTPLYGVAEYGKLLIDLGGLNQRWYDCDPTGEFNWVLVRYQQGATSYWVEYRHIDPGSVNTTHLNEPVINQNYRVATCGLWEHLHVTLGLDYAVETGVVTVDEAKMVNPIKYGFDSCDWAQDSTDPVIEYVMQYPPPEEVAPGDRVEWAVNAYDPVFTHGNTYNKGVYSVRLDVKNENGFILQAIDTLRFDIFEGSLADYYHENSFPAEGLNDTNRMRYLLDWVYPTDGLDYYARIVVGDAAGHTATHNWDEGGTEIAVDHFAAQWTDQGVLVSWRAIDEWYLTGFNLLRSEATDAGYVILNSTLIPLDLSNGHASSEYSYLDMDAPDIPVLFYKLEAITTTGETHELGPVEVRRNCAVSLRCFPNPAPAAVTIRSSVPRGVARARVAIYTLHGRVVRTLAEDDACIGTHEFVWDGRDGNGNRLPSGVYFCRLASDVSAVQRKVVLLR